MEEDREFVYLALERCRSTLSDYLTSSEGRAALIEEGAEGGMPRPSARCMDVMQQVWGRGGVGEV
jgi:serine/threonine-protein kinase/endoribonuclease IRE1